MALTNHLMPDGKHEHGDQRWGYENKKKGEEPGDGTKVVGIEKWANNECVIYTVRTRVMCAARVHVIYSEDLFGIVNYSIFISSRGRMWHMRAFWTLTPRLNTFPFCFGSKRMSL